MSIPERAKKKLTLSYNDILKALSRKPNWSISEITEELEIVIKRRIRAPDASVDAYAKGIRQAHHGDFLGMSIYSVFAQDSLDEEGIDQYKDAPE